MRWKWYTIAAILLVANVALLYYTRTIRLALSIVEVPAYSATMSTANLQKLIDDIPPEGGELFLPVGIYRVTSTIHVRNRTGIHIRGIGGHPSGNPATGTILKWEGKPGQPVMHWDGVSRASIRGVSIDGNSQASIGLHLESTPGMNAGNYLFDQLKIRNCATAIQIGVSPQNHSGLSECDAFACELVGCNVGIDWQADQAGQWRLYGLCIGQCGTGIRTGPGYAPDGQTPTYDRGSFEIIGGSFGANGIDFDLPSLSGPVYLQGVISEYPKRFFLRSNPTIPSAGGNPGIKLTHCITSGQHAGILMRQAIGLIVDFSKIEGPIQAGNADANPNSNPLRKFTDCDLTHAPVKIHGEKCRLIVRQDLAGEQ